MKTNFEHLRKYQRVFGYATEVEKKLLFATSVEELEEGGNSLRKALEGLLYELEKAYHVRVPERTDVYGQINLLKTKVVISEDWKQSLQALRGKCNITSHFQKNNIKPNVDNTRAALLEAYQLFYEMSYIIATYCLDEGVIKSYLNFQVKFRERCIREQAQGGRVVTPVQARTAQVTPVQARPAQVTPVQPRPAQARAARAKKTASKASFITIAIVLGYIGFIMLLVAAMG